MANKQSIEIGQRLKDLRKDLGMNQIEFGDFIQSEQPQLSRIERGVSDLQIYHMLKIASVGYNLHWLITGEGNMRIKHNEISIAAEPESTYAPVDDAERLKRIEAFLKANFPDYN